MIKIRKLPLLLLEVLIALALVALLVLPLLAPQVYLVKFERQFLYDIEADRLASEIFADVVQSLFEGDLTLAEIQDPAPRVVRYSLLADFPYEVTYRFDKGKSKEKNDEASYHLISVIIEMFENKKLKFSFPYSLFLEEEVEVEGNEEDDIERGEWQSRKEEDSQLSSNRWMTTIW